MKLLVIDNCDYVDYPTGGVMAFYRSFLPAMGNTLALAGITTKDDIKEGMWMKKELYGNLYDFYCIGNIKPNAKRPFIPQRIKNCFNIRKHIHTILSYKDFDIILTQDPEVLFFIPDKELSRTCYISPGVNNPLSVARYPLAKHLGIFYDKYLLMPKVSKVKWLLAAADYEARQGFADRSNGHVKTEDVIEFPTRYDERFYYPQDKLECRKKTNLPSEAKIFVTVGRLGWFKGWKLMIDSFKIYNENNPLSILIFIGDGEDEEKIKNYIKENDLSKHIILLGKKGPKEIGIYLNAADVFIMGSFKEGWSTTLVEACACGVPCVVTNFSSAKSMITESVNGFVVKNRDEYLFAEKMAVALYLNKESIIKHNTKFKNLALSNLKEDFLRVLNSYQ